MYISALSNKQLKASLAQGLGLQIGGFSIWLRSTIPAVTTHISGLYSAYTILDKDCFFDFHIELNCPSLLRRFFRPQVEFSFDGHTPFKPLPYDQAAAMFEWGLNWCIANHSNQFLIMHAAVVELNGRAFVFPGAPGSGKSTLCAALVCNGWRLFSDEMTLVSIVSGQIYPVPRPVSLKNQSIDIIQEFSENAIFGNVVNDTAKGTVGHMKAPDNSVFSAEKPVQPAQLIFPKYKQGADTEITALSKGKSVLSAAEQCFNYSVLGRQGFDGLCALVDKSECYEFSYSRLDEAVQLFTEMSP